MKLSAIVLMVCVFVGLSFGQGGIPAGQVKPGSFQSGTYTFPGAVQTPKIVFSQSYTTGAPPSSPTVGQVVMFSDSCSEGSGYGFCRWDGSAWHLVNRSNGSASTVYINVKSAPYNATGDGTTDDTAAVKAAITAAAALSGGIGGVIYFPPGNYNVGCSDVIEYNAQGIKWMGDTRVQSIIGPKNTTGCIGYPSVWFHQTYPLTIAQTVNFLASPLLTGQTNAYQQTVTTGGKDSYINLRDCNDCAELNGLGAATIHAVIKPSAIFAGFQNLIGKSSGSLNSLATNNNAFELSYDGNGKLKCALNIGGTLKTVLGTNGDIVAGNQYDIEMDYDGSNVYCFKNGVAIAGSPVAATGTITQNIVEDVHFPGCSNDNHLFAVAGCNSVFGKEATGITGLVEISNVARHTSGFTPITAVPTPDSHTLVQMDFVTNYTAGTKVKRGTSNYAYLPLHYGPCPAGVNMTNFEHLNMTGGVVISNGVGVDIKDAWFTGNTNVGLTIDGNCNFEIHLADLWVGGTNHRQGLVVNTGISKAERISANFGRFGIVGLAGTAWRDIFIGASSDAYVPMTIIGNAGSNNTTDIQDLQVDYETPSSTISSLLTLDAIENGNVTSSFFDLAASTSAIPAVIVNQPSSGSYQSNIKFQGNRFRAGTSTTTYVKYNAFSSPLSTTIIPYYSPLLFEGNAWVDFNLQSKVLKTDAPAWCDLTFNPGCYGPVPRVITKLPDTTNPPYPLTPTSLTSAGKATPTAPSATGIVGIAQPIYYNDQREGYSPTAMKTGSIDLGYAGEMWAVFDGATTAGHYAQMSTTQNALHDTGSTSVPSGWYALIEDTTSQPTAPASFSATVTNSGGSIPDGTYHYGLTFASCGGGETTITADQTFTISTGGANNGKVTFRPGFFVNPQWPNGICGFRVYVNSVSGGAQSAATLQTHDATTCTSSTYVASGPLAACTTPMVLTSLTNTGAAIPVGNTAGQAAKIIVGGN